MSDVICLACHTIIAVGRGLNLNRNKIKVKQEG